MTPLRSPEEIRQEIVLLLDDYQQELWDKFGKGKTSNYEWRTPELWTKYSMAIGLKIFQERDRHDKLKKAAKRMEKALDWYVKNTVSPMASYANEALAAFDEAVKEEK